MTHSTIKDKRQNSDAVVTLIERITGSFRDTTALITDRSEQAPARRSKAAGESQAAGKTAPKAGLYPDAYHNRIDGIRRMIARRGWLPEDECVAFAKMMSNAMVRSRALVGKESSPVILARWLRKEIPGAGASMLADAAARACSAPQSYIPKEEIGRVLKHTFEEAKAIGIAKTIYPFDIPSMDYERFLEKLRRARANVKRSKVDRATYLSNARTTRAKAAGMDRTTHWRRERKERERSATGMRQYYIEKDSTGADLLHEPAHRAPPFTAVELTGMAKAVESGLQAAGNAVAIPGRREALARLFEIAAKAFAPRPSHADAAAIGALSDEGTEDTNVTNEDGAAGAPDPSPAFAPAARSETRARERGDTIPAGQLLAIAAGNATPSVPSDVIDADDDALARHMLAMGHLTEAELAWIMVDPWPSFPPASRPIAAAPVQAVGGQSGSSSRIEVPVARRPAPAGRATAATGGADARSYREAAAPDQDRGSAQ